MGFKRIICVDFDGVLHFYGDGWKGATDIYDLPVPGAIVWLEELVNAKDEDGENLFEVAIYSSRSKEPGGVEAMEAWLTSFDLDDNALQQISFPTQKPAAWITIDDRCFQFRGVFPTADYLLGYQAWMKDSGQTPPKTSDADELRLIAEGHSSVEVGGKLLAIADRMDGKNHG